MASSDLDPVFVKALKLLLSRSKESTEQLKQMVEEVVEQRKKEIASKLSQGNGDEGHSAFAGKSSVVKKDQVEMTKKREREAERANLEKLKQDIANLVEEHPPKKPRLEVGSSPVVSASASPRSTDGKEKEKGLKTKTDSKEKPRERLREIEEDIFFGLPSSSSSSSSKLKDFDKIDKEDRQRDKVKDSNDSKEEKGFTPFVADSGSDTEISGDEQNQKESLEDMQFKLELGTLTCVVCKDFRVTATNQLMECLECHSLYHQECHKPPVTENVNDPRFVWYCNKCAKNMKKIATKTTSKKAKTPLPINARESPIGRLAPKPDSAMMQQPFKRLEQPIKSSATKGNGDSSSSSSGNGRGLSGLASLAANLSKSSTSLDASKTSKSDTSRLSQLSTSSHSAFTARSDTTRQNLSDSSLKSSASKGDMPLKTSSSAVRGDSAKSTTGGFGSGQSRTPSTKPTPSSNAASSSVTAKMSQSSLMSADKRLQMMKKQAAKMAEKRSGLK